MKQKELCLICWIILISVVIFIQFSYIFLYNNIFIKKLNHCISYVNEQHVDFINSAEITLAVIRKHQILDATKKEFSLALAYITLGNLEKTSALTMRFAEVRKTVNLN